MNQQNEGRKMKVLRVLLPLLVIATIGLVAFDRGWIGATTKAESSGSVASAASASEATEDTPQLPRTITVVGQGTIKIEPDIAQVTVGVETVDASVRVATDQTGRTMTQVMAALKAAGIAEKDMQTSGFSIWADRNYGPEGSSEEAARYRVNNNLNIVIRDMDEVGAVIDAAIEAGANTIHSVRFSVADSEPLEAEARAKAIEDAKARAAELAALNDLEVGQVVSVSEVVGSGGGYLNSNFAVLEAPKAGLGGAGPISPGELELSLRVQVVYAIR
jgi:uncharacterized protein YggE